MRWLTVSGSSVAVCVASPMIIASVGGTISRSGSTYFAQYLIGAPSAMTSRRDFEMPSAAWYTSFNRSG